MGAFSEKITDKTSQFILQNQFISLPYNITPRKEKRNKEHKF
jgi:hypothetical protein